MKKLFVSVFVPVYNGERFSLTQWMESSAANVRENLLNEGGQ
jgi:hypothetical protein